MARMFWERWRKEYLPEITKRHKWDKQNGCQEMKEGELVLLDDSGMKKKTWSLARIVQLIPSDDGIVRVVKVRAKDGVYTRPVARVGRLEGNLITSVGEGAVADYSKKET